MPKGSIVAIAAGLLLVGCAKPHYTSVRQHALRDLRACQWVMRCQDLGSWLRCSGPYSAAEMTCLRGGLRSTCWQQDRAYSEVAWIGMQPANQGCPIREWP